MLESCNIINTWCTLGIIEYNAKTIGLYLVKSQDTLVTDCGCLFLLTELYPVLALKIIYSECFHTLS